MSEIATMYVRKNPSEPYLLLRRANGVLEEYRYDSLHWEVSDESWRFGGVRLVRRWSAML